MSKDAKRPNILLAISDDQAWPHAGAYGCRFVNTPSFDRIAREGILFTHAYCPAPQCSPSRAALLTGRNIWQLEEAGTHASLFPAKYEVYPELLEAAGYHVGYTGKPWGPGNWKDSGRSGNPAGPEYNTRKSTPPTNGISSCDYAGNFEEFLKARSEGKPFCFWYGCREPHRGYEKGSGLRAGKSLADAEVPPFLPDNDEIRSDLLDYALEIEWYDAHLGRMIQELERIGELDNTLVVVTSDNGMAFPYAKANLYENGIHIPMAVRWGNAMKGGRIADDFISFIDLAPTFLEAAGLHPSSGMAGKSLVSLLQSNKSGIIEPARDSVITGRERHSHARYDNLGYPVRAIRTSEYLYIRNFKPERWPMGDPEYFYDVDDSPTKAFLIQHKSEEGIVEFYRLAFDKRHEEELFHIKNDPGCLHNLVDDPEYAAVRKELGNRLEAALKEQKDPRVMGNGDVFDSYPRFNSMREHLGGFAVMGEYNPKYKL